MNLNNFLALMTALHNHSSTGKRMSPTELNTSMKEIDNRLIRSGKVGYKNDRTINDSLREFIPILEELEFPLLIGDEAKDYLIYEGKTVPHKYYLKQNIDPTYAIVLYTMITSAESIPLEAKKELKEIVKSWIPVEDHKYLQASLTYDSRPTTSNRSTLINIGIISEAIFKKRDVTFQYCQYDSSKKLVPKSDRIYRIRPIVITYSGGHFHTFGEYKTDKIIRLNFRIDKMINLKLQDSSHLPKEYSPVVLMKEHVRTIGGEPINVKLKLFTDGLFGILDPLIDEFGEKIRYIKNINDKEIEVSIRDVGRTGMLFWVLQYSTACCVLEPDDFRCEVKESLERTLKWYE